jgi:F0F1-type ATP synthase delta subunit
MEELDLSDLFNTKSQAQDFSQRLESISSKIFETSFNPETALLEYFGIEKKETFMNLLRDNKVNAGSRLAIKEFIDKIQQKIASLPVLSMVLAFEPHEETLEAFSRWFIINTKKQMLFEIKVDKSLIGGAAILSNGKYLDFSIKPAFEKVIKDMSPKQVSTAPVRQNNQ